jgi:hypothetical protein
MCLKSKSSPLATLGSSINKIFLTYAGITTDHLPELFLCCTVVHLKRAACFGFFHKAINRHKYQSYKKGKLLINRQTLNFKKLWSHYVYLWPKIYRSIRLFTFHKGISKHKVLFDTHFKPELCYIKSCGLILYFAFEIFSHESQINCRVIIHFTCCRNIQ